MSEGERCSVCEAVESDPALLSDCYSCGKRFHLNPYSNREEQDCGDAWIGETLGVEFHCDRCIESGVARPPGDEAMMGGTASPTTPPTAPPAAPSATPSTAPPPEAPPADAPPARRPRRASGRRYRRLDDG